MPRQNRVLPTGKIVAIAARGTLTGNRGVLHDAEGRLGTARWRGKAWICCMLEFKGVRRKVMSPGTWTELFFLDEAVALAAGHRPCAYCRRAAFTAYRDAFPGGPLRAPEMDAMLHAARVTRDRRQVTHRAALEKLPDGAFILWNGAPHLVLRDALRAYRPEGYAAALRRPAGEATVLTPAPSIAALRNGYRPLLHPTARPSQAASSS